MPAHHGLRVAPTQPRAHLLDPHAPRGEKGIIDGYANFEHRPSRGKKQIGAREASRIVERQRELGVQSSLSGAIRTPRSSRINPSSLKSKGAAGAVT